MDANPLDQAAFAQSSATPMMSQQAPQPQGASAPPQIFGNYSPDGTLLPPNLPPGSLFADDALGWGYDDANESAEAKRRRIARACDMCRKKKIKCDAKMPKCSHCENYKTECVFTHVEKKRAPPKGAKYIEGLENRLGRMEHLLRLSGLLGDDEEDSTDLGTLEQRLAAQVSSSGSPSLRSDQGRATSEKGERRKSTPQRTHMHSPPSLTSSPKSHAEPNKIKVEDKDKDKNKEMDDLADMMWCSLVTNNQGETRFVGSSSGFSIFSPKGVQWVSEKTGDNSFHDMITAISADDNKWYPWREEVFGDIFARRTFKSLPPQEECLELLSDFFTHFNRMFPLFHEPTFMHLVDREYSDNPYTGSGWWASLNVALAIAFRIRIMKNNLPHSEEIHGWGYFKNSLAVLSELTMRNTDLLSVQGLIGMSLYLQGTPNPQPSFYLIGAALRLAHSIGLHKHGSGFGLNNAEIEQRKRVFWIAYLTDKDICLRSGRPPAQDDDDWNVELPSENPDDGVGNIPLSDGTQTNIFRSMCQFSVICSKVYNRLYSVKASKQSDGELLNTIGELDAELEEWKDSIPIDFRPEHDISNLPQPLQVHIAVLHFAYYNCLTTIHRRSVHHGYWSSRLADYAVQGLNVKPLNPRVFSSAALCVSAARTSIHLIKYIPPGDYSCVWLILYYPVSALITLFANILQNPQDARARSDLKLMNAVVAFLQRVSSEDKTGSMQRMYVVCREFERIAGVVLDKAEREMTARQKRKQEKEREKLEKPTAAEEQQQRRSQELKRPAASDLDAAMRNTSAQQQVNPSSTVNGVYTQPTASRNVYMPDLFNGNAGQPQSQQDYNPLLNDQYLTEPSASPWFSSSSGTTPNVNNTNNWDDPSQLQQAQAQARQRQQTGRTDSFAQDFPTDGSSPFLHPFVPQDLWQMPMTFEWDWMDMTSGMPFTFEASSSIGGGLGGAGVMTGLGTTAPAQRQQQQSEPGGAPL